LIGLEFQYMYLAFRPQWISMRNSPRKQSFSILSEDGRLRGKARRFSRLCRPYYVYGSFLHVSHASDSYNVVKWTSTIVLSPSVIRSLRWKTYLRSPKYFLGLRIVPLRWYIWTKCWLRKRSNSMSLQRIPAAS
jgi:hypothetical protein